MIERACFEVGIKLGAVFHQFIGVPIGFENVETIERAIESCVRLQPYVVDVKVEIDRERLRSSISDFGYTTLSQDMLNVDVLVDVEGVRVRGVLRWVEDLNYPLMEFEVISF